MSEKNKHIRDILPQHHAPKDSWSIIVDFLDSIEKQPSDNIKSKLPEYNAPDIFGKIETEIKPTRKLNPILKVAASITILLTLAFLLNQYTNLWSLRVTHSVEKSEKPVKFTNDFTIETSSEITNILAQQCKIKPQVCSKPEYNTLQKQLAEIENEINELKEALSTYNDPNLEKHLIRLANDKVKIETYLLKLFS